MKVVIDIPEKDIPKRQEIMTIDLYFIDGTVCASSYPCEVLPKGHGRLVDAEKLLDTFWTYCKQGDFGYQQAEDLIKSSSTIIEANKGDME